MTWRYFLRSFMTYWTTKATFHFVQVFFNSSFSHNRVRTSSSTTTATAATTTTADNSQQQRHNNKSEYNWAAKRVAKRLQIPEDIIVEFTTRVDNWATVIALDNNSLHSLRNFSSNFWALVIRLARHGSFRFRPDFLSFWKITMLHKTEAQVKILLQKAQDIDVFAHNYGGNRSNSVRLSNW